MDHRIEALVRKYTQKQPGILGTDDIRQIVRMGIWEAMASFDPDKSDNFEARAYVIAQNRVRNQLRKHPTVHFSDDDYRNRNKSPKPIAPHSTDPTDNDNPSIWDDICHAFLPDLRPSTPEEVIMQRELEQSVAEAISSLSDQERKLLEDVFSNDRPQTEETEAVIRNLRNHIAASFNLDMDSLFDPTDE